MSYVVRSEGGVYSRSIVGGVGEILQGKRASKTSSVVMSRGDLLSNGSSLAGGGAIHTEVHLVRTEVSRLS